MRETERQACSFLRAIVSSRQLLVSHLMHTHSVVVVVVVVHGRTREHLGWLCVASSSIKTKTHSS